MNGVSSAQPRARRVAAASSGPRGAPWASALPCLAGEPKPMRVWTRTSAGASSREVASASAAAMAAGSLPSATSITRQPYAWKRRVTSSETAREVAPSMVMSLSS